MVDQNTDSSIPRMPWWLVALCVLIAVLGLYNRDLWTPDEPREAAICMEMMRTGNLAVPHLAGEPFVEKPPLYYVTGALFLKVSDGWLDSTVALRSMTALWTMATLFVFFMLVRRLFGVRHALLSVAILATMPGFVNVSHWLLVDNALVFFSVASVWLFAEYYLAGNWVALLCAGIALGGAFLSKGLVGPVIVFTGWVGLFVPWLRARVSSSSFRDLARPLVLHILTFGIFAVVCGVWMLAFRLKGGEDLWHEWFWVNHFGRFKGEAEQLGHQNGFFYYFPNVVIYVLPWVACLVIGWIRSLRSLREKELDISRVLCLLTWGLGGLAVLTLSVTKRDIYLAVLLPAFAATCPFALAPLNRFVKGWINVVCIICMAGMVILALLQPALVLVGVEREFYGVDMATMRHAWGWTGILCLLAAGFAIFAYFRNPGGFVAARVAIIAVFYIILLHGLVPVLDLFKSYGPGFQRFAESIETDAGVVGWNLDETTRAGLYYYADRVFPRTGDMDVLKKVLEGKNEEYNRVIVCTKGDSLADKGVSGYSVVVSEHLGKRRNLQLLTGQ